MRFKNVGRFLSQVGSLLCLGGVLGLAGCGADAGIESAEADVAETGQAITNGWTTLKLRNGWLPAANSNVPAVGIVNGIVTFRGALNGSQASSPIAFCLTAPPVPGNDFTKFRPADVGYMTLRAALANGASGSLIMDIPFAAQIPPEDHYCVSVNEDGAGAQPGPAAKAFTSLEGVSFDRSAWDSTMVASPNQSPYPQRGSDAGANPAGQGVYAKVVNGFTRMQAVIIPPSLPLLFTLPSGKGMIPGKTVYVPVTLCPLFDPLAGRLVIRPTGAVEVEGSMDAATCGVSLDGVSFSVSSPASAQPIGLSNGWVANSSRPVRSRPDGGVVRLEGAVKNGTSMTLGTLPVGMRPAKTIFVVANALQFATPATLSINSSGVIKVVTPPLVVAQSGISFDGVSFGL